jgi:hypothetical protein
VGRTKDLKRREARHLRNLQKGKHCNVRMQRVYDQYGQFEFEVLEVEDGEEERRLKEAELLKEHYRKPGCLNQSPFAHGGDHGAWTQERRNKIAAANKRRKWTQEQREKIAASNRRRPVSAETRKKISENYVGSRGKTFSEESRQRMRDAQQKRRARERAEREDGKN